MLFRSVSSGVASETLFSAVPLEVYVIANFKETQLTHMHPGQPATVRVDAYPDLQVRGHVDSFQRGTGANFALLPPENATGNFVKVVQRVPVKIIFDDPLPADHTIGPGLSVTPDVQVSKYTPPAWTVAILSVVIAFAAAWIFLALTGRKNVTA